MTDRDIEIAKLTITATLAFLAVLIARRQANTAHHKLQYDLYDRRFAIYEAASELVRGISHNHPSGKINALFETILSKNRQSAFLLSPRIQSYLKQLQIEAAQYNQTFRQFSEARIAKGPIDEMLELPIGDTFPHLTKLRENFHKYFDGLVEMFHDELDFRQLDRPWYTTIVTFFSNRWPIRR